jgi:hypothetical protein
MINHKKSLPHSDRNSSDKFLYFCGLEIDAHDEAPLGGVRDLFEACLGEDLARADVQLSPGGSLRSCAMRCTES